MNSEHTEMKHMYLCMICNHESSQKSHHYKHINSNKHKQQRQIKKLELEKIEKDELLKKFNTHIIEDILDKMETTTTQIVGNKKHRTNKTVFEKSKNEVEEINNDESFKSLFINFIGKMHNLLRGGSAVTGNPALDDILNALFLCYIEDKISDSGEFDLMNSEKSCYKGTIQRRIKDFCKCISIDYLIKHPQELRCKHGLNSIQKCAEVLSRHPKTNTLFRDNKDFINCQDITTLQSLLTQCKDFSVKNNIFEYSDIIGYAYEYMTTKHAGNGGTSKEMGQYFTERPLMSMCYELIDPEDIQQLGINDDSTLGDEFCATFGFPLTAREFFKTRFKINIQDKNMYGVEYHERLSRFAYMNAMFAMKNTRYITHGDSFITNIKPHLDISVHNVPFGKSMTPKNIEKTYNLMKEENSDKNYPNFNDIIPYNSKKIDAILASQLVLYKTKKMGLMIIKDGEETSGKSNDKYRKWFMENCVIKKIMKIPSGAFSCTGTKTVCIYFIKKEGQQTENIQFLQLSDDGNKITEICNVSMGDMKHNDYSWDPNSYIVDEEMEKMMSKSTTCEWKTLHEIITPIKGLTINSKNGNTSGKYPLYYCSILGNLYLDSYQYDQIGIIMNKTNGSGKAAVYMGVGKYNVGNTTLHFKSSNIKKYLTKYIYYFIKKNIKLFEKYYTGSNQKSICYDDFKKILIPTPSLEIQNNVVQTLDDLAEQKQLLTNRESGIERQMKYYLDNQTKKMVNNEICCWKMLKEICEVKGGKGINDRNKTITNDYIYPYYDSNGIKGFVKEQLYNGEYIVTARKLSIGSVHFVNGGYSPSDNTINITSLDKNKIINKYLYHWLKENSNIFLKMSKGIKPGIRVSEVRLIKIPIPSIEIQTEIVKYLDKLEAKKNSINDEINDIDILMKDILTQSYC